MRSFVVKSRVGRATLIRTKDGKISISEMARRVGVSPTQIARIIRGTRGTSNRTLSAMAAVLGTTTDALHAELERHREPDPTKNRTWEPQTQDEIERAKRLHPSQWKGMTYIGEGR